jgi:hypothetical protein
MRANQKSVTNAAPLPSRERQQAVPGRQVPA